jgi:hypothetical protein
MNTPQIGNYYAPNKTNLRKFNTANGESKNEEWLQIVNVPCKIVDIKQNENKNEYVLNSFTSASIRQFVVPEEEFSKEFYPLTVDEENGVLKGVCGYPVDINVSEFESRNKVTEIEQKLKKFVKDHKTTHPALVKVIEDKLFQLIQTQGAPYVKISDFKEYKEGKKTLTALERFGEQVFNRNSRWCSPTNLTHSEYEKTLSYPAPLGIRPKDFALPSEVIETTKELVMQIAYFKNVDPEARHMLLSIIECDHCPPRSDHCCLYCGKCVDLNDYSSSYMSETNYIEICHRDPNDRFLTRNMYWGHGDCNRRQGGYSEADRIREGLSLAARNIELLSKDDLTVLIKMIAQTSL